METTFAHIPIADIRPNPLNPRRHFDQDALAELARSIQSSGIIQPLVVYERGSEYILVCGERRYRAACIVRMELVPAIVHQKPLSDEEVLSFALVENLQRKDVDVLSEAAALRRLADDFRWTQVRLADELGVSAGYVRSRLLLTQHAEVLAEFAANRISLSQAAVLAAVRDPESRLCLLNRVCAGELTNLDALTGQAKRENMILEIRSGGRQWAALRHEVLRFDVAGLPRCAGGCPGYVRLSYDEKRRHGIDTARPGWSELCTEPGGDCFAAKAKARQAVVAAVAATAEQRPLQLGEADSILWFRYNGRVCRTCGHMVDTAEFSDGCRGKGTPVGCYCTKPGDRCYRMRTRAFVKARQLSLHSKATSQDDHRADILRQTSMGTPADGRALRKGITKRECTYLLLQLLCYAGGQERLVSFARRNGWHESMPVAFRSQVGYVRNKLLESVPEETLLATLFSEAAAAAAYAPQDIPPLRFDWARQTEVPMNP